MSDEENTFNLAFNASGGTALNPYPTVCNPGTTMLPTGWYNGATYQQPQFVPTVTSPTEEIPTRQFCPKCHLPKSGTSWHGHHNIRTLENVCQCPRDEEYQPSFTFPTEESLRAFVKKCVHEALDELADEMRDKALQPTSRVE